MFRRRLPCAPAIVVLALPFILSAPGCGGGGSSKSAVSLARQKAIASTRVSRQTMAMAGLGRMVTRSARKPSDGIGRRASAIWTAIMTRGSGRAPVLGYDSDTKLYYVLNVNADGSGREDLFVDEAHQKPAGSFAWGVPKWKDGQSDHFPAVIHVTFEITAGEFAGVHGTMDLTVNDPAFASGVIHIVLINLQKEHADADFDCSGDMFSGTNDVTWPDGTTYEEEDKPTTDGGMTCTITYSDGSVETLTVDMDGNGTTTVVDASGTPEAVGDYRGDTGDEQIDYSDGTEETVNVDTGNDVSDTSTDSLNVRRAARLAVLRTGRSPARLPDSRH